MRWIRVPITADSDKIGELINLDTVNVVYKTLHIGPGADRPAIMFEYGEVQRKWIFQDEEKRDTIFQQIAGGN